MKKELQYPLTEASLALGKSPSYLAKRRARGTLPEFRGGQVTRRGIVEQITERELQKLRRQLEEESQ